MTTDAFRGPIFVTAAYFLVYYAFIGNIVRVRTRLFRAYAARGEKFDRFATDDKEMLAADRTQLNMLEQMPPFLALMWLHAVFVGAFTATIAGAIYVATRALYPVILGGRVGRGVPRRILPVTLTGYAVIAYLAATLVWSALA